MLHPHDERCIRLGETVFIFQKALLRLGPERFRIRLHVVFYLFILVFVFRNQSPDYWVILDLPLALKSVQV